jgi:histidinol-phosphate aminotransferase
MAAPSADLRRLARRAVLDLEPYAWELSSEAVAARHGLRVEDVVRFDLNTSPFAPAAWDEAMEAARREGEPNEYFDTSYAELTPLIGSYCGVDENQLVVGAGADEVLDVIAKTFLDNGDLVVTPQPTYPMYAICSVQLGARVRTVASHPDFSFDVDGLLAAAAGAKILWLCNPNSPTATLTDPDVLERLIEGAPCIVAVDEAYAEFAGFSAVPLVRRHDNLIVVRTMSKAFGMAGMRLAWGVAQPPVIELLNRVRPPNSVSRVTARVGAAALRDTSSMRQHVGRILAQRDSFAAGLAELGAHVYPSATNFLLTRWPSPAEAQAAYDHLESNGIVVRNYATHQVIPGHLRITVRTLEENQRLLSALSSR